MGTSRAYTYKDVEMLFGCQTVVENFKSHKDEIVARRAIWADPYITHFQARINTAMEKYLGLDTRVDLKAATQTVNQLQAVALKDLSFLKVQIEQDFATDKVKVNHLLDRLGFYSFWTKARYKDQQALVQLLYQYRQGLTDAVKAEIVAKGTDIALLQDISTYADTLKNANVSQETLKSSSKELTEAGNIEFNAIYEQAIAICKISAKLFEDKPQVKEKFIFSQIIKKMTSQRKETVAETIVQPAA